MTAKLMEVCVCASCGIEFGMPSPFIAARRNDGKGFWCPNGHSLTYGESEADKLRRERDRLKQQQAHWDDERRELQGRIETEGRRRAAARGQVTRLKNRAKAGLCPCCNRHFTNLERHMASQHPEAEPVAFAEEA